MNFFSRLASAIRKRIDGFLAGDPQAIADADALDREMIEGGRRG